MLTRRSPLLALTLALLACGSNPKPPPAAPGAGPADVAAPSAAPAAAPAADALPLWPRVRRGTLPNGLTYYVLPHGKPEKRAFLWLAVNAGSVQEDDDQRGLAHFVEHMAFNGTKRFPKQAIVSFLESIGMKFGAHLNAYTSYDETVYQLLVPTDEPAHVARAFDVLHDWASGVAFDPAEIEKERGVVLEEWRLGRGAQQRIFDKLNETLLQGTRYALRQPIGLPDILKRAPRDAFLRFYRDWYRPDLMAVIAVGDFPDPAAIEKQIAARFGDLPAPATPRPRPAGGVPKATGTRVALATDRELPQQLVSVYNLVPRRPEATAADYRRSLTERLFTSMLNERLGTIARRPDAPFQMAFATIDTMTRDIDAFSRTALVKGGRVEETLRALFAEVLRVERHGFTASELERARTNLRRFFEQSATEEATSDSSEFADEITRNFFEGELMIGREAERDLTLAALPQITLAELNALARAFGGAENRAIGIAGPDGKPLPAQDRVLAIIGEVARGAIEPWEDRAPAAPLMAAPPQPGKITKEATLDALGVTEWTLSNGARVIVKATDFEKDSVMLSGISPGGLAVATAAQYPHARFADDVVPDGGLGALDAEDLERALAGKVASAYASIDEVTESIDASGSARDLETILQLVHLRMTAPRKDPRAFEVWKANFAEQLADRQRVPEVQFGQQSQQVLWQGHPRRKPATPADVAAVDLDQALAFYRDRFGDASDFTFVIVGAVDLARLRPLVETYLASLPAKGRREKERDVGARRIGGVVERTWSLGQEQKAFVTTLFHGDEPWTREKERDLYVLGQVLQIRLREILREDMGGVYGVGAGGSLRRSPVQDRVFTIQFGCAPESVKPLTEAAQAAVAAIAKQGIGADYLEKVKQAYLRERETAMRTNGFWVNWLESAARFGDDPKLVLDPAPMLARMTPDRVKASAARFLDGRRMYRAILMPGKDAAPAAPAAAPGTPAPAKAPAPAPAKTPAPAPAAPAKP